MDNPKLTGSYYTPEILSDFLMSHVIDKYLPFKALSILEPSCGDGKFVKSFFKSINNDQYKSIEIDLIDIQPEELKKAKELIPQLPNVKINAIANDYLNVFLDKKKTYDLIVGNPPYIRKKHMGKAQIDLCEKCHDIIREDSDLINSKFKINNIWTVFVETAILSLSDNGILCFVLPSDILQVNYAQEIRQLIQHEFDRVEIFAFNELIFENIQQDVVAIIGVKGVNNIQEHGFSFYQVNQLSDLKEPTFTEKHNNIHRTTLNKWTNYILSDAELNFIEGLKSQYNCINKYCEKISAGIVTAANDYFIVNQSAIKRHHLNNTNIKPILPKGSAVPNLINFTINDFEKLLDKDERVNFIHFPNLPVNLLGINEQNYVSEGEKVKTENKGELNKRFKMTQREHWYHVPNIWNCSGLFIKRSSEFPKIIVNTAQAYATDSFYRIIPKNQFDIKNIVFSFYNSLTMVLSELEGRFYGGGVLELTPNEFKNLVIPYNSNISNAQFIELDNMFRRNEPLNNILNFTDNILFASLPQEDIDLLRSLRIQLMNRRLKKNLPVVTEYPYMMPLAPAS